MGRAVMVRPVCFWWWACKGMWGSVYGGYSARGNAIGRDGYFVVNP